MNNKSKTLLVMSSVIVLILSVVSIAAAGSGGSIKGGGQMREAVNGSNGSEVYKISFGGRILGKTKGEWQVNFHNVGVDSIDKSKFHTTNFSAVNYFEGNSSTCNAAFNFTAFGKWNNKPGYKIIFRGGDFGSPGKSDTARVTLIDPEGTEIYDTHWSGEFTDESNCIGGARTGLDKGNLTIVMP